MSPRVVNFDHHSPNYHETRDELLKDLRHNAPVAWSEANGGHWVVTSYELVRKVITDPVNFTVEKRPGVPGGLLVPASPRPAIIPGEVDGAEHDRYRRAVGEPFNRKVVAEQEAWIRPMVEEIAAGLVARNEFDVVQDYALAIPVAVVLRYLRLDVPDPVRYFQAAERAIGVKIEEAEEPDTEAQQAEIDQVWDSLFAAAGEKRRNPDGGVISYLARRDPPLTDHEVRDMLVSVVLGGARTSAALIENILWQLDVDREMRAKLAGNFGLIPKAVDEFARYFSPSQVVGRTAANDVELGGVLIHKNDRVLVSWHSANHDEREYPDPETLKFDRKAKPNVAFGVGPHFCLGTWLAKLEVELAMQTVFTMLPGYALDQDKCRRYGDGLIEQWVTMPAFASGSPSA
jgi:cytochrome P450